MPKDDFVGTRVKRTNGSSGKTGVVVESENLKRARKREAQRDVGRRYRDMVAVEWEDGHVGWHKKGALEIA